MRKIIAICVAAVMLFAMAVSVCADGTATVSSSFTAYSTGNQYETLKPVTVGEGIEFRTAEPGIGHIDITALIEQIADLENVTSIKVTLSAVGADAFVSREDGGNAIIGLKGVYADATSYDIAPINWGTNQTPYTMEGAVLEGTEAVYVDTSSHGAIAQDSPMEFEVSVDVTYVGDAKIPVETTTDDEAAPAESTDTPAEDTTPTEDTTPAETGVALALVPMAVAAAAVVISKRR